jgi:non-ribosomal peptide synthetase component F
MKNADSIHDGCVPDMEWGGADTLDSRQAVPEFEIEQPITKRFEQQVVLNRGRLAVKTQTYELTYNELNRWANRIARSIAHTTGPDAGIVAILLDHDAPLIAAILAVLKSGNCYVAMDPSHPVDRLHNIIDDSQASLLITDNVNFSLAENIVGDQHSLLNLDRLPLDTSDENL